MADDEQKKKIMDSSFKGDDDDNEKKPPTTATETPVVDIPAKVKQIAVKGELWKLLNENHDNSSTSPETVPPMDDIQAKMNIPATNALKGELSSELLILNDTSPLKLNLSDEAKRDILRQMNDKVNANKRPMLEMDDIPAKVKIAAAAKSETPDLRFPLKTDYPRCYGIGPLSETIVSESRLRPTIGERSSDKADRDGDDDGSNSSDDENGNVSVSESDDVKHGGEGNCSSDN